jgi:hypothetical protein
VKKIALLLVLAIGALLGLSACSNVQTEAATCAYVIQNGYFDAKHVRHIAYPGERVNTNNVTVREAPCNARNYIIGKGSGDYDGVLQAKTGQEKSTPGTPVDVQLTTLFTLNESRDALNAFLPFCEKYNCFNEDGHNGSSGNTNYASPGWVGMLKENMLKAESRAVQQAMLAFPPDIWNDQSKWPAVADEIMKDLPAQLEQMTGSTIPFFCASGAHWTGEQGTSDFKCPPVTIAIDHIDPPQSVRDIYDQQVQQAQQQALAVEQAKTNLALLGAAKAKYGPYAGYFLGLQDTIGKCNGSSTCVISIGNAPVTVNAGK